jgi:hypothetical protein
MTVFTEEDRDELINLQSEKIDLAYRIQRIDGELAATSKHDPLKRETRNALIALKADLSKQHQRTNNALRTLKDKQGLARRQIVFGSDVNSSPTAQLREVARRVGTLEHLFATLVRGMNGEFDEFDWTIPVLKAQRQLEVTPKETMPKGEINDLSDL